MVKNPPAVWETWLRSLGWEDPLEEGMATHSSSLSRTWTVEPGGLQTMGLLDAGADVWFMLAQLREARPLAET